MFKKTIRIWRGLGKTGNAGRPQALADTAEAKSSRDVLAVGDWKGPWVRMGNFHRKRTVEKQTGYRAWQPVLLEKIAPLGGAGGPRRALPPQLTHSTQAFLSWAWWDRPLIPGT